MPSKRPEWDDTFLAIARIWSERSTCSRRKVGAVVVKDKKVIGNGYNGVPAGAVHCVDGGCPRGLLSYDQVAGGADYNLFPCYAIHAEHNAILQAGLAACAGATLYVTDQPCQQCTNLIEHAGIGRIVVGKKYDEYVDAVNMNNAAKSNVHSAYGGSTASHMDDVLDTAAKAQKAEDDAWGRVLEDPEG